MARQITIGDAIVAITPTARVTVKEDNFDKITWRGGTVEISKADIEAKMIELQTAEDDKEAQEIATKASAKAKLIAGEALTEDEANTIVL